MEEYDTIILGYPNWWASIPMPGVSGRVLTGLRKASVKNGT
jgi:putative NADPH-quinone reductase